MVSESHVLVLKFLNLALKFLKYCPKKGPNFLSEGAGQPADDVYTGDVRGVQSQVVHVDRLCLYR